MLASNAHIYKYKMFLIVFLLFNCFYFNYSSNQYTFDMNKTIYNLLIIPRLKIIKEFGNNYEIN